MFFAKYLQSHAASAFYFSPYERAAVLSIGDSHTQGYGVRQEHTFPAIIEKHLEDRGRETQVINAGISGFSTASSSTGGSVSARAARCRRH